MTLDERDHQSDEALRAAFAALRRADAREAPSFASVLAPRRQPRVRSSTAGLLLRVGVAAGIVLAAGVAHRDRAARRLTVPHEVVALVRWRPVTDALLATPGSELLRHPPSLSASMLDVAAGGDQR